MKRDIDSFVEEKNENREEVKRLSKQNCVVSLEIISEEQPVHRITDDAFKKIQISNKFIWNTLDGSKSLEECKEHSPRNYFIVPLMYVNDQTEIEMDYDSIQRICFGAKQELNGQEWVNKIKPSRLKNSLVQYKNELCISYGIHKDLYNKHQEQIFDESDKESVASFCCNQSVQGRFDIMGAGGKSKLNKEKNVILTRTVNPNIHVKILYQTTNVSVAIVLLYTECVDMREQPAGNHDPNQESITTSGSR